MKRKTRLIRWVAVAWALIAFIGAGFRVLADCASFGLPFTDLGSVSGFCAAIAEAYYTGITNGTSSTTFSPGGNVSRAQMAAFVTRTLDASLTRGSRRAALGQWWTTMTHYDQGLGLTTVGAGPGLLQSDGADIWVANNVDGTVSRVRASDGSRLEDWSGATHASGVLAAMGRIFVTGANATGFGSLFMIDPTQPAGAVVSVADNLGRVAIGIAFDGNKIWTANNAGSVSIITPGATTPWAVTTVATGFQQPQGIVFDGLNVWVADQIEGALLRLDASGAIIQTVTVGTNPGFPVFDGHNIWVPNSGDSSISVVRAFDGAVLRTLSAGNGTGNGLSDPIAAAFDGQRILVTNLNGGFSLFKADDLSPIVNVPTPGFNPYGVCSDGQSFWVSFGLSGAIGRF